MLNVAEWVNIIYSINQWAC